MRKRSIALNCTQAESECRLRQQLRIRFPKGSIGDNYFRIYKRTTGRFLGAGGTGLYCFIGYFQQSGKQTHVEYRVYPNISVIIFTLLLFQFTCSSLYHAIFMDTPPIVVVIELVFLLIFILIKQHEKKKCIADFENRLKAEIHFEK